MNSDVSEKFGITTSNLLWGYNLLLLYPDEYLTRLSFLISRAGEVVAIFYSDSQMRKYHFVKMWKFLLFV